MWPLFRKSPRSRTTTSAKRSAFAAFTLESLEDRRMMAVLAGTTGRTPAPTPTTVVRLEPTVALVDPTVAWINQNIQDVAMRSIVQQLEGDHVLSRNDMISILNQTAVGGVTTTELNDLKDLVSRPDLLGTPIYVQNLADKVINGDPANAHFQGTGLGNLATSSTSLQLNRLTSKWFLGADRPELPTAAELWGSNSTETISYQVAAGTLFGSDGPTFDDVDQGRLADCWYMGALEETARMSPALIQNMFIDNGDNTYTVRFFHSGEPDYVTVDRFLPVAGSTSRFVFANNSDAHTDTTNTLWAALAEKAYAQLNESDWIGRDGENAYQSLAWGWPELPMRHLTGQSAYRFAMHPTTAGTMGAAIGADFNAGHMVTFCSRSDGVASNIVPNHCYAMLGYDAATNSFTLGNPWGANVQVNSQPGGVITLSAQGLFNNFGWFAETNPSQAITNLNAILDTQIIPQVWEAYILDLIPTIITDETPLVNTHTLASRLAPGSISSSDSPMKAMEFAADAVLTRLPDNMPIATLSHSVYGFPGGKAVSSVWAPLLYDDGPSDKLLDQLFAELAEAA
jgi:hypothetical protein